MAMSAIVGIRHPRVTSPVSADASIEDRCGRSLRLPPPDAMTLLNVPDIANFMAVSRQPENILSGYEFNDLTVRDGLLAHVFPALLQNGRSIGRLPGISSVETILHSETDIVFDWSFRAPEFAAYGIWAACVSTYATEESLFENVRLYARALHSEAQGEKLISTYRAEMTKLAAAPVGAGEPPKVLAMTGRGNGRFSATNNPSFTRLLTLAGARNARADNALPGLFDAEALFLMDPDIIVIDETGVSQPPLTPQFFYDSPEWKSLRAVRSRSIYVRPYGTSLYFTGIVDTPLYGKWLRGLVHAQKSDAPASLRPDIEAGYKEALDYALTKAEIDDLLKVTLNRDSRGYASLATAQ
jgi:iron complex transport system substrate-binding protein